MYINIHRVCMFVCMMCSTASQGCASVHCICMCVSCHYFANPSSVSACMTVHSCPCVLMLVYTMLRSYVNKHLMWSNSCHIHPLIHTLTRIRHFHSSRALCTQPRETTKLTEVMKARQKCRLERPKTGCWTNQASCIEEKQRVRQTAVVYTQKIKQTRRKKYVYKHEHSMYVCMYDVLNCISRVCECALHWRVCVLPLFR